MAISRQILKVKLTWCSIFDGTLANANLSTKSMSTFGHYAQSGVFILELCTVGTRLKEK